VDFSFCDRNCLIACCFAALIELQRRRRAEQRKDDADGAADDMERKIFDQEEMQIQNMKKARMLRSSLV
jgi:hypothetical protein